MMPGKRSGRAVRRERESAARGLARVSTSPPASGPACPAKPTRATVCRACGAAGIRKPTEAVDVDCRYCDGGRIAALRFPTRSAAMRFLQEWREIGERRRANGKPRAIGTHRARILARLEAARSGRAPGERA